MTQNYLTMFDDAQPRALEGKSGVLSSTTALERSHMSSLSPSENISENTGENTLSRLDTTLEDCAVYYFAGYTAKKCLNKFNCATCASTLKNENSDKMYNCQALTYFKTYFLQKRTDQESVKIGHLTGASESLWEVTKTQLKAFSDIYDTICHEKNISLLMENHLMKITNYNNPMWFSTCCEHRTFILRILIRTRIYNGLKWTSKQQRDAKRNVYFGNIKEHVQVKKLRNK